MRNKAVLGQKSSRFAGDLEAGKVAASNKGSRGFEDKKRWRACWILVWVCLCLCIVAAFVSVNDLVEKLRDENNKLPHMEQTAGASVRRFCS